MVNILKFCSREASLCHLATNLQITVSVIGLFPFYVMYDLFNDVNSSYFWFLHRV